MTEQTKTFNETVQRAVELFRAQPAGKRDLLKAAMIANEEAGDVWNVSGVQNAAYKIIYA